MFPAHLRKTNIGKNQFIPTTNEYQGIEFAGNLPSKIDNQVVAMLTLSSVHPYVAICYVGGIV